MSKAARPAKPGQRSAGKAQLPAKRARAARTSDRKASNAKTSPAPELTSQFTLKMRESLHRELARLAFEAGMTMRGFIMNSLKSKGLSVTREDLVDRRRR